ncbi:MAG TPA: 2Fe-2S iron-sulfur cluster-binding protein [Baekduia sp.]|nr:2Fe-2S iron-sulfur cluster-binding protein [Baekduia sp.]
MPSVTYIDTDGSETTIDAPAGVSVMQTALMNGVDGIVGECGGNLMCATCHVYVDEKWADRLSERDEVEEEMLEETAAPRRSCSRLSCQIELDDATDGLVVHLPETQV